MIEVSYHPEVYSQSALDSSLGAYQALYAITEMDREEFEKMFDHTLFHSLREEYGAEGVFPEPWDKVSSK